MVIILDRPPGGGVCRLWKGKYDTMTSPMSRAVAVLGEVGLCYLDAFAPSRCLALVVCPCRLHSTFVRRIRYLGT